MTKDNKSKILQDLNNERCYHGSVSGQTSIDWICNHCGFISGKPDKKSYEIYSELKLDITTEK